MRALGYRVLRVRHHGDLGKLELAADELERALQPGQREAIADAIRAPATRTPRSTWSRSAPDRSTGCHAAG